MISPHANGSIGLTDADFELIAESIPEMVWLAAPDGSTIFVNRCGTDYTGLSRSANDGWDWLSLLHPEDLERTERAWRAAVESQSGYEIEARIRRHDGSYRRQRWQARPVHDGEGRILRWIGTATDIEDQRRLEECLRAAERRTAESLSLLETLQSSAPIGFGFVDRDLRVIQVNQALAAATGEDRDALVGRLVSEVVPELWSVLAPLHESVLATGNAVLNVEATDLRSGDTARPHTWLCSFYPVRVEAEMIGVGIIVVDITERREMEVELQRLSERDPLTGLYNRRQFFVELDRILHSTARHRRSGAVLMLDVDNFKWTNDTYGHSAGDRQLKSVAQILVGRLRDTDIVGRIGGDEFAIVLPEATEEQARTVASHLRSLLCERPVGPPVYASIGMALFNGTEELTPDDLLVAADVAMYQVKEKGGDGTALCNSRSDKLVTRVKDLRSALAEERFAFHAQPIVDLRTDTVARRELLIRMRAKDGEIIPPGVFLPIAERFSLIGQIDRWAVGQALVLARREPIAVNLSGRSVGDQQILAAVARAIADGLNPSNVTFEITETAVITDLGRALAFISALSVLGCELALDDFGTGFGSFNYLKHLPARYLKIDTEFVRDINDDPTDREIVQSIVGIAHSLGKRTIAEGVENAETLETLRELDVDFAQGFHLGHPEPIEWPSEVMSVA